MKTISYVKLQKSYGDKFIARKDDQILAYASTYSGLVKELARKHIDRASLTIGFVPSKKAIYIYNAF